MPTRILARLFGDHLGTTPVAVAQTRRVHFARNLIRETDLPIIIPCHRVIGASGKLTGYAGGIEAKQKLLDIETA